MPHTRFMKARRHEAHRRASTASETDGSVDETPASLLEAPPRVAHEFGKHHTPPRDCVGSTQGVAPAAVVRPLTCRSPRPKG